MTDTNDLARTDAPERIWVDFAECPSGAMIGSVYTSDLGDIPYILATPAALAASPEVQALLREARVQVIEEVTKLPNRIEPIGGQNHRYVRIEEILLLDPATIVAQVDAGQAEAAEDAEYDLLQWLECSKALTAAGFNMDGTAEVTAKLTAAISHIKRGKTNG